MKNNLNTNEEYFSCRTFQCFKQHLNGNYQLEKNNSCPFCSYNMENDLKLRQKIKNEILKQKNKVKTYHAKFLEYTITFFTGILIVGYVTYYLLKLLFFHK